MSAPLEGRLARIEANQDVTHNDLRWVVGLARERRDALTIADLVRESYETSRAKGWHPEVGNATTTERLMLIVSELAEALEELRAGRDLRLVYPALRPEVEYREDLYPGVKPEGFPIEIADAVIRIGGLCGCLGIDLERALRLKLAYNLTRPHRHGGKVL